MKDWYLEDPRRLEGQPKRTIADYVEQNGILVPRRFGSLKEARRSHRPILCRSEHTQEYDGASGLLSSLSLGHLNEISDGKITDKNIKTRILDRKDDDSNIKWAEDYCDLLDLDIDKFREEISYSLWEKLKGVNRVVIADSAIKNRYHILTCKWKDIPRLFNYTILNDSKIERSFRMPLPDDLNGGLEEVVNLYERIRNLDRFDPNHCPILEVQTVNGKNYFLQYHRCRDFEPVQFSLDRSPKNGEVEALFVRGATPSAGLDVKTTVVRKSLMLKDCSRKLLDQEDASFDADFDFTLSELMLRKRKAYFMGISPDELDFTMLKFISGHWGRSKLYKPKVSVIYEYGKIKKDGEFIKFLEECKKTKQDQYIDLHVVSDGRKAFIRRI